MKAVIYARYSSHNQTEQSIEGQLRVCEDFAQNNGYTIHGTYIDRATTGTNDNRPDFQKMLKDSSKGIFEVVLVYQLDRFARNRYDSAVNKKTLKDNGVRVVSAMENFSDDASGVLMESIIEGMAEYYSKELSQKILRGKKETAKKLRFPGGKVPFGFTVDENRHYIPDPKTAPMVVDMFRRYASGVLIREIVDDLNLKQIATSSGLAFPYETVRKIFRNEIYIGTYKSGEFTQENAFEPIIDMETWERVQKIMESNKRNPAKSKAKEPYFLSGKIVCGCCGQNIVGGGTTTKGVYHGYYVCNGRKKKSGCQKKNIRKDVLESRIVEIIVENFSNEETKQRLAKQVIAHQKSMNDDTSKVTGYKLQLEEIKKKKENLMKALERGSNSPTILARVDELEQAEISIGDEILRNKMSVSVPRLEDVLGYFDMIFTKKSDDFKQGILRDVICYVKLFDENVLICFNLLDEYGKNMEVCEVLDSSDLGDRV